MPYEGDDEDSYTGRDGSGYGSGDGTPEEHLTEEAGTNHLGSGALSSVLWRAQGLLYHRTCKPDFLCSWPSLNSYLK